MFRFDQKYRQVTIRRDGNEQLLKVEPSWDLWKVALAIGAILYSVYLVYRLAEFFLRSERLDPPAIFIGVGELLVFVLVAITGRNAALEAASREEVRIKPEYGSICITTRLWTFQRVREFPISEIRNLHTVDLAWRNQRETTAVEFHHGKSGYRFAQGASQEDRAKIVRILESVGVSTLD